MEDDVGVDDGEYDSVNSSRESQMEDDVGVDDSEFDSVTSSQESVMEDDVEVEDSESNSVTSSEKSLMEDNVGVDDSEFESVTSQKSLMEDSDGVCDSEFGSVTSSQKSLLKHVALAESQGLPTKSTGGVVEMDTDSTEVLGILVTQPVVATPVLSFTTPTTPDSVNDDVFRTPPEIASLSGTADSEPKAVSEVKTVSIEGMKSPTPASGSPSLVVENVRATETLEPVSEVAPLFSTPSIPAKNVRVPVKLPGSASSSSSKAIGRSKGIKKKRISTFAAITKLPKSLSPAGKNTVASTLAPPSSMTAKTVRVPAKNPYSTATGGVPGIKISETAQPGGDVARIPFREIIKAILHNSGQLTEIEDHGNLSCVDTLKKMGVRFP